MNSKQVDVIRYYTSPESRLGYTYLLWDTKHFGYHPIGSQISEKDAQIAYVKLLAEKLGAKKNHHILDAGCGRGIVACTLANLSKATITGIDIVDFELSIAQKKAIQQKLSSYVTFQKSDYSHTPFANNTFDAIYTTETLSHSPDIMNTLKEFHRVLKPGGKIALFEYTIAPDDAFTPYELETLETIVKGSAMHGLRSFRHDSFPKILSSSGFSNIVEENVSEHMRPSLHRLYKIAYFPYQLVRMLRLKKQFVNITAGYECYKMADKKLLRYCIFTGVKPKK